MATDNRTAIQQSEFAELDELYNKLGIGHMLSSTQVVPEKQFDVGETMYGYVTADVSKCYRHRQRRITMNINGRWIWTTRFVVEQGLWIAKSHVEWADCDTFASAEQFASQWLAWKKTNKRQHGIRATQSFPMFNMAVAI